MARRKRSIFERLQQGLLTRSERRKLAHKVAGSDPGLSIVHPHAAGIDVGNGSHFVAVPPDRLRSATRTTASFTERPARATPAANSPLRTSAARCSAMLLGRSAS